MRVYLDNALSHLFDTVQNMVTDLWGGEESASNIRKTQNHCESMA